MTDQLDTTLWATRAERLLEQALSELRNDEDPISSASAAEQALRVLMGEAPEDTMDGFPFPGEEPDESACICSPEQRASGGFRSACPIHGVGVSYGA